MGNKDKSTEACNVDSDHEAGVALGARRRALLAGLGKGSALLAAASPVHSFATGSKFKRRKDATEPTKPDYQCTVSGQMSVLISDGVATNPCGGYHCTHFVKCEIIYRNDPKCNQVIKDNCRYVGDWKECDSYGDKSVCKKIFHDKSSGNHKYAKVSCDTGWNTGKLSWNAKCSVITSDASHSGKCMLQRVYEAPDSDDAMCIAGYLNVCMGTIPSGASPHPFDKFYVSSTAKLNKFGSANLYRKTCIDGKKTYSYS